MKEVFLRTALEIRAHLSSIGEGCLFRGQTQHHVHERGRVGVSTSFARRGCVPFLMQKWGYYANHILRALTGSPDIDFDLVFPQAVLQHYGWRSFFIDASADPGVAAWFASNHFAKQVIVSMCDDCFGEPLLLGQERASYLPSDGDGHLYILSKESLDRAHVRSFDLTHLGAMGCRPRFHAQRAWMIGPLRGQLPPACVAEHIAAPTNALREFAASNGYTYTADLFPPREEDPILRLLLSVPWIQLKSSGVPEAFVPGLMLPEYDFRTTKCASESTAFFRQFWVAENRGPRDSLLGEASFYRLPEAVFYAKMPDDFARSLHHISMLLRRHGVVIVEADGIMRPPGHLEEITYDKGVCLKLCNSDVVELSALTLDHPGTVVAGTGIDRGWYYQIDANNAWSRISHADECPCNNGLRHLLHLAVVVHFDEMLGSGAFNKLGECDFTHAELPE